MAEALPVKKFIKVWVKRRKNNPRKNGKGATTSFTLEWVEFGQRRFQSLGKHATRSFAKAAATEKERQLNSPAGLESLEPIDWAAFRAKYLDTFYPGHDLEEGRKEKARTWGKAVKTMLRERASMDHFQRLMKPDWCHTITPEDREKFIQKRLVEAGSAATVNAELGSLRAVFNVMEEWDHRPEGSNPFAGRGKATVGARRKRNKGRGAGGETKPKHYSLEQIQALLNQADKEVEEAAKALEVAIGKEEGLEKALWQRRRLRAMVYSAAYTGARIQEIQYLEWNDLDLDHGAAWLYHKIEHDLKTEGSQAPFGLPDVLVAVLREWEKHKTCSWVFPNAAGKPWVNAGPGYRPFDQFKALAARAGIPHANWKLFRHSLATHGKQRYGLSAEQLRAQLRHTTTETQKHYTHDDVANLRDAVKDIDFHK